MPGYCVLLCCMRSFSVIRGPYSNGWPGGAFFGDGVVRRWGCEGGRNLSGFARTRGLEVPLALELELALVLLLLTFFNAAPVEVKLRRVFWRWRMRRVIAEGGPRGRRKPGIGVGIFGIFFLALLLLWRGLDDLVDLSRCGTVDAIFGEGFISRDYIGISDAD